MIDLYVNGLYKGTDSARNTKTQRLRRIKDYEQYIMNVERKRSSKTPMANSSTAA